ncbi:MAG: toll/interleukin-1 receptor domain-containing protein, partial [Muribaculaceae bacterium]
MADYDIFISYRRVGGADFARQMQLALKNKGYSVFLDFDELKDGVFDRRIEAAIKSSKVFIFILSPHALDRCKNEEDWVRKEIECALLSQCHIVPVNPNAVFQGFDDIEGLPYVIKNGLGQHQISTVMMNDLFECTFNEFVQHRIAPIVSPTKPTTHPDAATGSEVHIETDIACRVMRFKEELITAQPDDDNLIHLKKGTHKLTFVSLENEQDNYSQVFTVKDECEILQVNLTKIRDARLAKEEAERRAKEEAERRAKEEAERRAREEAERRAKEEAERRAKEEAERRAKEEA